MKHNFKKIEGYTPGKWAIGKTAVAFYIAIDGPVGERTHIATVPFTPTKEQSEIIANASLIALAPALYEAVQELTKTNEVLREALEKSVEVIIQWHGLEVFDIYYNNAPEMKLIREALNSLTPKTESK